MLISYTASGHSGGADYVVPSPELAPATFGFARAIYTIDLLRNKLATQTPGFRDSTSLIEPVRDLNGVYLASTRERLSMEPGSQS